MPKTKMQQLTDVFETAKGNNGSIVAVVVKKDGFPKNEVIVNSYENIELQLAFYKEQYDEDLKHRFSRVPVTIVDFMWARDWDQLSRYFVSER
jgi:hypothetical protein